jgi:hypothetical protein
MAGGLGASNLCNHTLGSGERPSEEIEFESEVVDQLRQPASDLAAGRRHRA